MSMVMNKGVKSRFKAVMVNFFTIVGILVEPSTAIGVKSGSNEESP